MMMPMDANTAGNVFGGAILKAVEEAAWVSALRHTHMNVVTASIDRIDFYAPVHIGDILRCIACINFVHKTSMEIGVRVEAENAITGDVRHTATCFITYVALDQNDKPTPIPPLVPETEDEKRRWAEAEERAKMRVELIEMHKKYAGWGSSIASR